MKHSARLWWCIASACLPLSLFAQSLNIILDPEVDYAAPDESFSQRIWIVNDSGALAPEVDVYITTPANVDIWAAYVIPLGIPASGWMATDEVITVSLGDLPPGAIRVITLPTKVENGATVGDMINWKVDADFASETTKSTEIVAKNGLQVSLTADRQAMAPGDTFWLTINLANPGDLGIARTDFSLVLDPNLEIVSSTFPAGSETDSGVFHSMGTVPALTLQQFRMEVRLKSEAAAPGMYSISSSFGGRVAEEFGGSTLHVMAIDPLPAGLKVEPGEPYTLMVSRLIPGTLSDAVLQSHLPQGTRIWAAYVQPLADTPRSGWQYSSNEGFIWNLPQIYPTDPYYIQFPVMEINAAVFARVQRNELVMGDLAIPADAPFLLSSEEFKNLSLELNAPDPVMPGKTFDLWVHYGNPAAESTDDAVLALQLPDGVTLVEASVNFSDSGSNLVSHELGTIRSGETGSIWLRLNTAANLPDDKAYDILGWIEDAGFPMKSARDRLVLQATEDFPMSVKLANAKLLLKNNHLWLTDLEITNKSSFPLSDFKVSLNIPEQIGFARRNAVPEPSNTTSANSQSNSVFWDFPFIEGGKTLAISIPWTLKNTVEAGVWYPMQVVLTTTEGYTSRIGGMVTASTDNDLSVHVQADEATVVPGESVWLTVSYANRGQDPSLNPSLELYLPAGMSFAESDREPLQTTPYVRYNLGSMVPGDRGQLRVKVNVDASVESDDSTTIVGKFVDQNAPVNSAVAEATLIVRDAFPVVVQLSGHGDPTSGRVRQMEVIVGNTSDDLLEDLTIWFNSPQDHTVDPDHIQPYGGSGGAVSSPVDYVYDLTRLPPGEPFVLTLPFDTINNDAGWMDSFTVHVNSGDGGYVRDTEHVVWETGILEIALEPRDDFAEIDGTLEYRVFVGNISTEDLQNVVLYATLPKGTTFVSATGGGSHSKDQVQWDIPNIPAGSVAYADFTVRVPQGYPVGGVLQNEAFVTDSESPRNSARATTSIPVSDSDPNMTMDVSFNEQTLTHTLTNKTGLELASARYWFTMPDYARHASQTSISARLPYVEDLLNVVSDEPQVLTSEIQIVGNPKQGHLYPYTGVARSDQGYGVVRRRIVPFTDDLFPIDFEGLNPEITQIWEDAESYDGGWVRSIWYGWFLEEDWPWILHAEHKWQYPFYTPFGLYVYDISLTAWLFTNQALYFNNPVFASLFVYDGTSWIPLGFYRGGVAPDRWFYHYGPEYDRPMNEAELKLLLQ